MTVGVSYLAPGTRESLEREVRRAAPWAYLERIDESPGFATLAVRRRWWACILGTFWWQMTAERTQMVVFIAVAPHRPYGIWYCVDVER